MIVDPETLITMDARPTRAQRGAAVAILRAHDRSQGGGHFGSRAALPRPLRSFLEAVASRTVPARPAVPRHPAKTPQRIASTNERDGGELTATELAWLNRLPLDPADVTFDDATQLAALAASVKLEHTASRRLVNSIWRPVDDLHTEAVARARLAAVEGLDVHVSPAALSAVAASFSDEYPDTGEPYADDAATTIRAAKARQAVETWQHRERVRIDRERERARADLDDVRARRAERAETTRSTPPPA